MLGMWERKSLAILEYVYFSMYHMIVYIIGVLSRSCNLKRKQHYSRRTVFKCQRSKKVQVILIEAYKYKCHQTS